MKNAPLIRSSASASASAVASAVSPHSSSENTSPFVRQEHYLLGYPVRRAAASEMLYGGIRVRHLVQPVFPLQRIKSELLPPPSLQREREDLMLEMQLPRDKDATQLPAWNIQNQVSGGVDQERDSAHDGFDMTQFFNDHQHPSLHHNSSMPYDPANNTNNVLALRLFPINIGIRDRTEAIRLRTRDCLERFQQQKLMMRLGLPTQYPLSSHMQKALMQRVREIDAQGKPRSLYSGALDPSRRHTPSTLPVSSSSVGKEAQQEEGSESSPVPSHSATTRHSVRTASSASDGFLPHMKGRLHFHPPAAALSIFTRPQDCGGIASSPGTTSRVVGAAPLLTPADLLPEWRRAERFSQHRSSWMPFQMLKPMGYNWSPARRSSGVRGPSAQLVQERLDQKGFGWKRKSRHLWQQDIHTAGFRPHRFY